MISDPMLEKHVPWKPDLWIEVNAGFNAIDRPTSGPLALVLSDPHVLSDTYYPKRRALADYVFNMQTPYMKEGDIHLPYAYSQRWHTPTEIPFADREWDAALIGLPYENRNKLVNRLKADGLNVNYTIGPAYDDARDIYHNTRVGLNWSSLLDTTARCFELMALGIPAVMNAVPDLMSMFEAGIDFRSFTTLEGAVKLVHDILESPSEHEYLVENALKAVKPHTWDARIDEIFKTVGLI